MFDSVSVSWEQTTLGAIATLGGGTTPSKTNSFYWNAGTIPWATPTDITSLPLGDAYIRGTALAVSETALRECSLPLNPPGTVLLTSRASIGFAAINDVPMTTNQGFITFRCNGKADPRFLHQWLIANRTLLVAAAGGSTFKELSRGTAKLLPILLPPLDEQRRIAEVLRSLDAAITNSQTISNGAISARQSLLQAHFHRADWEPDRPLRTGWRLCLLDDVAKRGSGHTPNKKIPEYWDGTIKWVSLQDTKRLDKVYIDKTTEMVTAEGIANSSAVLHPSGTVVISRDATVGKSAILVSDMAVSQHFIAYTCGSELNSLYLYYWLQHMKPIFERIGAGSTIKTIGLSFFRTLNIALPDLKEQVEFATMVLKVDNLIDTEEKICRGLKTMKAALSNDLLSGRVRVPS